MDNKAQVGGILNIVAGAFGFLGALYLVAMIFLFQYLLGLDASADTSSDQVFLIMGIIYGVMGAGMAAIGIVAIVGGVFSLKKRNWPMALAGSIAGSVTFFPCGIAAIILVAMGQPEFHKKEPLRLPEQPY